MSATPEVPPVEIFPFGPGGAELGASGSYASTMQQL